MNNFTGNDKNKNGWRNIISILVAVTASLAIALGVTSCGGGGGSTATIAAPGMPTTFSVIRTPEVTLSATLTWSIPASGGDPSSFEVYRSTTSGQAFQDANNIISIPVESGKTVYTFIDNAGLTAVDTYWVVSAKNAGGETPTAEVLYKPIGPPSGGGDTGYGNNFSSALIFADDIGIGGLGLDPLKSWTQDLTVIDFNTGLRPTLAEVTDLAALTVPVTTLPYLDPTTTYTKNNVTFYKQATSSTWQGQWERGSSTLQDVTAKWGDNLVSQSLTGNSTIRIEMVLSKALTTPMTSYWMQSLYGAKNNEVQGTDGTTFDNSTAFVFASNAHLKIEKLLDPVAGTVDGSPLYDQSMWTGDGPGFLAAEVNVGGNFTYGFVWNLKGDDALILSKGITTGKMGTWRITFSLDNNNSAAQAAKFILDGTTVPAANNNTNITSASNGVLDGIQQVHIDIQVGP